MRKPKTTETGPRVDPLTPEEEFKVKRDLLDTLAVNAGNDVKPAWRILFKGRTVMYRNKTTWASQVRAMRALHLFVRRTAWNAKTDVAKGRGLTTCSRSKGVAPYDSNWPGTLEIDKHVAKARMDLINDLLRTGEIRIERVQ